MSAAIVNYIETPEEWFENLFQSYYEDLYFYGIKLVSNETLVKDELQELFAIIWTKRQKRNDINNPKIYLLTSLRRRLLKAKKQQYTQHPQQDTDFELSIEDLIIQEEQTTAQLQKLEQALAALPKAQKEIIYLKFYQNLDYKDIAAILKIKYQSVRNNVHRAITKLRTMLR